MAVHLPSRKGTRRRTALAQFWKCSGKSDTPGVGRRRCPGFSAAVAGIRKALSPSGCREGLAGKAPGDNGNGFKSSSFKERLLRKRSNVPEPGHIGPPGFQDKIGKVRPFALADGFKPGGFRRQVQTADTGEQADVGQF